MLKLTKDIDAPRIQDADLTAFHVLARDDDGSLLGSDMAAMSHFEMATVRLHQIARDRDAPADMRVTIGGRLLWNLTAIERHLIERRPKRGPFNRHLGRLIAAGLVPARVGKAA